MAKHGVLCLQQLVSSRRGMLTEEVLSRVREVASSLPAAVQPGKESIAEAVRHGCKSIVDALGAPAPAMDVDGEAGLMVDLPAV